MTKKTTGEAGNTENAIKKYSAFANDLMYELHGAKSLADATKALILRHEKCDEDRELISATFVLEDLADKLDRIALQLDSSSFSYVTKAKAVSATAQEGAAQ